MVHACGVGERGEGWSSRMPFPVASAVHIERETRQGVVREKEEGQNRTWEGRSVPAAIVFVIIKNAIRNCKLENGRERAGRRCLWAVHWFLCAEINDRPAISGRRRIIVDVYVPTSVVMRSSYRASDPTKKREREGGDTGRLPDKCGICNGPGNKMRTTMNLQILISCWYKLHYSEYRIIK